MGIITPLSNELTRYLDLSGLELKLTAQNMANVDVPGYRAVGFDFADAMERSISETMAARNPDERKPSQTSSLVNYVSQQRVTLDDSITRLTAAGNYNTGESTQLQSAQDSLIQTNMAQVAAQLSSAQTQQGALTQVIAAIDRQGTLFNVLP